MNLSSRLGQWLRLPRFDPSRDPQPDARNALRNIFRASSIIGMLSSIFVAGAIAKELVIARQFGRSSQLDSFLIAFLLPSFVVQLFAESFNSALVPVFIEVREKEGRVAAQRLLSSGLTCSAGLQVLMAVLLALFAPFYLPMLATGFAADKLALTRHLLYALLPFVVFHGLASNWTSVLNAHERFALPAITPLLTPLAVIAFILWGKSGGVFRLAAGTVTGSLLEMILLGWVLHRTGTAMTMRWHGVDERLRAVARQYLPVMAGMFLFSGTMIVDQAMAAMLPAGSVAALNYASKPIGALLFVGVTGLSAVTLPYFSSLSARADWPGCRKLLVEGSRFTLVLSVPLTFAVVLFSRPLIRIVFQRGAFTPDDTVAVAAIQSFLALQIPFYIVCIIGARLMNALKVNQLLMALAGISLLLKFILNYIFIKIWGLRGIALATSLVYATTTVLMCTTLFVVLKSRTDRKSDGVTAM